MQPLPSEQKSWPAGGREEKGETQRIEKERSDRGMQGQSKGYIIAPHLFFSLHSILTVVFLLVYEGNTLKYALYIWLHRKLRCTMNE